MMNARWLTLALLIISCRVKNNATAQCPDGQQLAGDSLTCEDLPTACSADSTSGLFGQCGEAHRQCATSVLFGNRCGRCLDGYKEERGQCRPVLTCATAACAAQNRECAAELGSSDAACGDCVAGAVEQGETCVIPTCAAAPAAGSIRDACDAQHRTCANATCGACAPGYVQRLGACVPVETCQSLGCAPANRLCVPQGTNSSATCAGCRGGYKDAGGQCLANTLASCDPSNTDNILSACAGEHRSCQTNSVGAQCGAPVAGYVENPSTLLAEPVVQCSTLPCLAEHRECDDVPNGHCTSCQPGFTEDTDSGACRAVVTCAALACSVGEACFEATDNVDARCQTGCAQGALWNGTRCEPCPPCNGPGELGRLSTPSQAGSCICKTSPGYFYSLAADVGTFACDSDGDGWVRESARNSLESVDPLLKENARCDLRKIDRFVLTNEAGESKTTTLSSPLALYETDRNDDDEILAAFWDQRGLPKYGTNAIVKAAAINRLTKLCHHPRTDYNDNQVPDVEEWSNRELAPGFRADQRSFNVHAYFAELHTAYYAAPPSGQTYGSYHIEERSRAPSGGTEAGRIGLVYAPTDATHWRSCDVDRDSQATTQSPPVGMDYANVTDGPGFTGMTMHSQFKCIVVDAQPVPSKPWTRSPADVVTQGLRLNRCELGADSSTQALNPTLLDNDCTYVDATTAQPGDVRWAAIPYIDYGPLVQTQQTYVRGCVNDCIIQLPLCPFYDVNPAGVTCSHDVNDFGKFVSCNAFEVCDGLDNDGIGGVDDGNPGGGFVCGTGQSGVCAAGHTNCPLGPTGGHIVCTRDITPVAETCDNLDNDCVNGVDDNNPQGNAPCGVSGVTGACASGASQCQAGGNLRCIQTVQPKNEICSNGVDDNCDGTQDEGDDNAGCTDYYYDFDGDGWGIQSNKRCLCAPDTVSKHTARAKRYDGTVGGQPFAFDCCDNDANTKPGQTTVFGVVNACSSFDYNCNGLQDFQHTSTSSGGCGRCCNGFCCCDGSAGWSSGIATCGTSATWNTGGCGGWSPCSVSQEQKFQGCN